MAWGQVTTEDLKKAGLDPAKIAELETKLGSVASKTDVEAQQTTLQSIQASLAALTDKVNLATTPQPDKGNGNGNSNPQPQVVDPYAIDPVDFMADPAGNIKKMIGTSMASVQLHSLNVAADLAYNTAKLNLPYFGILEAEIKAEWDKYTPLQKGKPQELIENIYNLIKGRNLDKIMTDTNKKEGKYNIIQAGGTHITPSSGAPSNKPEPLTSAELAAAAKFGMSEDEWRASKGGLKYV